MVVQVLGLPPASVRVLAADSSRELRAASFAAPPDGRTGTEPPVSASAHGHAPQPCTEGGVCSPKPVARVSEAFCSTSWRLAARSVAPDSSPAPGVLSAQRHSRYGLCEGQLLVRQHLSESVSSASVSGDEVEVTHAMRRDISPSRPRNEARASSLTAAMSEADVHAVAGALPAQLCAASEQPGSQKGCQARSQPPAVGTGQPIQQLLQPSDTGR